MAEHLSGKLTRGNGQRPGHASQIRSRELGAVPRKHIFHNVFELSVRWNDSDSCDYSGWCGQDEAVSVPLIPSFLHPSFTLREVALGTHLCRFRHASRGFLLHHVLQKHRYITLWDWMRLMNTKGQWEAKLNWVNWEDTFILIGCSKPRKPVCE